MVVSKFNQYFWDSTSMNVNSSVVSYSINSTNSTELVVRNTKKPIVIYVPRHISSQPKYNNWMLQQSKGGLETNYHRIQVLNNRSLHIEFLPTNYCINFDAYLKHNQRPTKENYDLMKIFPDMSQCNTSGLAAEIRANICTIYTEFVSMPEKSNYSDKIRSCDEREKLEQKIRKITSLCEKDPFRMFLSDNNTKNGTYILGE